MEFIEEEETKIKQAIKNKCRIIAMLSNVMKCHGPNKRVTRDLSDLKG